jgi:hypothetical protein
MVQQQIMIDSISRANNIFNETPLVSPFDLLEKSGLILFINDFISDTDRNILKSIMNNYILYLKKKDFSYDPERSGEILKESLGQYPQYKKIMTLLDQPPNPNISVPDKDKIQKEIGLFIKKYQNFWNFITTMSSSFSRYLNIFEKNILMSNDTPVIKQIYLYNYLFTNIDADGKNFANFFSTEQKQYLKDLYRQYRDACLSMPNLSAKDISDIEQSYNGFVKLMDTPLTDKNNYRILYNFSDSEMEALKQIAKEEYVDNISTIIFSQIKNIKEGKYGMPFRPLFLKKKLFKRLIPRIRMKKPLDVSTTNLEKWENFINSLFLITTAFIFNSYDLEAASIYYEKLKTILQTLGESRIYYTLAPDVSRLGEIMTSIKNNKIDNVDLLSREKFSFMGKLEKVEPSPIEIKLLDQLKIMDQAYKPILLFRNNYSLLLVEIHKLALIRDADFINYILSFGQDNVDLSLKREEYTKIYRKKPYKIINRIIKKYLFRPIQEQQPPSTPQEQKTRQQLLALPQSTPQEQKTRQQLLALPPSTPQEQKTRQQLLALPPSTPQEQKTRQQQQQNGQGEQTDRMKQLLQKTTKQALERDRMRRITQDKFKPTLDTLLQQQQQLEQTDKRKQQIRKDAENIFRQKFNINPDIIRQSKDPKKEKLYNNAIYNAVLSILEDVYTNQKQRKQISQQIRDNHPYNFQEFKNVVIDLLVQKLKQNELKKKKEQQDHRIRKENEQNIRLEKENEQNIRLEKEKLQQDQNIRLEKEKLQDQRIRKEKQNEQNIRLEKEKLQDQRIRKEKQNEQNIRLEKEKLQEQRIRKEKQNEQNIRLEKEKLQQDQRIRKEKQNEQNIRLEKEKLQDQRIRKEKEKLQEQRIRKEKQNEQNIRLEKEKLQEQRIRKEKENEQNIRLEKEKLQQDQRIRKEKQNEQNIRLEKEKLQEQRIRKEKENEQNIRLEKEKLQQDQRIRKEKEKLQEQRIRKEKQNEQNIRLEKEKLQKDQRIRKEKQNEQNIMLEKEKLQEQRIRKEKENEQNIMLEKEKLQEQRIRKEKENEQNIRLEKEKLQKDQRIRKEKEKLQDQRIRKEKQNEQNIRLEKEKLQEQRIRKEKQNEQEKTENRKFMKIYNIVNSNLNNKAYNIPKRWETIVPFLNSGSKPNFKKIIEMANTLRNKTSNVNNSIVYTNEENKMKGFRTIQDLTTLLMYEIDPKIFQLPKRKQELDKALEKLREDSNFNKFLKEEITKTKPLFKNLVAMLKPIDSKPATIGKVVKQQKESQVVMLQQPKIKQIDLTQQKEKQKLEQETRKKQERQTRRRLDLLVHLNGLNIGPVPESMVEKILSNQDLYNEIMTFNSQMTMEQYNKFTYIPSDIDAKLRKKIELGMAMKQRENKKKKLKQFLEGLGIQAPEKDLTGIVVDEYLYNQLMAFDKDTANEKDIDEMEGLSFFIKNALVKIIQQRQQERRRKEEQERILRQKQQAQRKRKEQQERRLRVLTERKNELTKKLRGIDFMIPSNLDALAEDEDAYNFLMGFDKENTTLQQLERNKDKLETGLFSRMKGAIEQIIERNTRAIDLPTLNKYAKRIHQKYGYPIETFDNNEYTKWLKEKFLTKRLLDGSVESFEKLAPVLVDHNVWPPNVLDGLEKSKFKYRFKENFENNYKNNINKRLSNFTTNKEFIENTKDLKELWKNENLLTKEVLTKTNKNK